LPVGLEHLVAGLADSGAIFLQARQHGEIALVDDRAAVLLHVTRTGLLLFRRPASPVVRVGRGRKSKRRKGKGEEIFTHRVPSFSSRVYPPRARHRRERPFWISERREPHATRQEAEAGEMRPNSWRSAFPLRVAELPFIWHI